MPRVGQKNAVIWGHVRTTRRNRLSDINMTPIMNLFILLIPFLLLSATFIELAVVHSALTEEAASGGGGGSEDLIMAAIVDIETDKFVLRSRTVDIKAALEKGEKKKGKAAVEFTGHDLKALKSALVTLKKMFPNEKALSIAPNAEIPYNLVISTMDEVRTYKEGDKIEALFTNVAFMNRYVDVESN